jgi:hypothetical protein
MLRKKKRNGCRQQDERRRNTAKLFVLLDAEPQGHDTQLIHSLNPDNLPSSLGRLPVNEFHFKSNDAAQK